MGKMMTMERIKAFGAKRAIEYVDKDYKKNAPKLLDWLIEHDIGGDSLAPQAKVAKQHMQDPESNWNKLAEKVWTEVDAGVRKKIFENFIIHASLTGSKKQFETMEKEKCNVPWAILLDPTSACNLHCKGCWAAEYGDKLNLTFDELSSIVEQGKAMGTYFYIFTGGEPLVRKDDVIRICEKHNDCAFLSFTNATLIDEAFTEEMLRVKNFIPAISIEGFKKETDSRRGEGTFDSIIKAMDILKKKKLPFGVSCTYTSENTQTIGSSEFFDFLIEKGALFAWLFTYMPVGKGAAKELIVRPEQRKYMYEQIREFRNTKAIWTMDFWNDGEFVGGCIAGGRSYLHINANGDIEPCAFIHYADSNIREHTLLEAYKRPLFMEYFNNQPFSDNMLRPCPLLDNEGALAQMVKRSKAHSTDVNDPEDVDDLTAKCKNAAAAWKPVADEIWALKPHHEYSGPRRNTRFYEDKYFEAEK